jgi:iron complex transport system substrate-binding protein
MKYGALLLFFAFLTLWIPKAEAGHVRVVSQTVGTDELLLALAEHSQIAALSHLAQDANFSMVVEQAKAYPMLEKNCDLEGILKYAPTILLCADYSREEIGLQARRAGIKVIVISKYHTLEDSFGNLRLVARELGPEAEKRAEDIIASCNKRIAVLAQRLAGVRPVKVIAPSTYGVIPGYETTFQDLCDHAGAENLAATMGGLHGHVPPPAEKLLTWPIERLVVVGSSVPEALAPFRKISPYQFMPAVRENRAVLLSPPLISCVTHHRVDAYEELARQLHPECFR